MAAHQNDILVAQRVRQRLPERGRPNQHIGHAAGLANFEDWHPTPQETAHVEYRPQPCTLCGPERDQRARVTMHDRHDFRPQLVDFAMDEALAVLRLVGMSEW